MDFATRDRYRHAIEELAARLGPDRGRRRGRRPWRWRTSASDAGAVDAAESRLGTRSRLLPDLRRPRRRSSGPRRPGVRSAAGSGAPTSAARPRATSGRSRSSRRCILAVPLLLSRRAAPAHAGLVVASALLALVPGVRPRDRARQPGRRDVLRAAAAAPARARRRRADRAADARRRADAAHRARPTSRRRSAASRSTTSRNRDGDLRFALLSDWLDAPDEQHARRRRAPRRAPSPRSTASTSATARRPAAARGSCSSTASGAGTQAEGTLDGLGAQARQARGAQRAAARLDDDTTSSLTDRPSSTPPAGVRYVVTLDADTRLPRGAVGRLVGTIAHPLNRPSFDPAPARVIARLRRPPAADHADAAGRARRVDLPAGVLRPGRDRPVRLGGVRRLPGPVRRGQLHRQGHLRRRRLRGRAGGPGPRERAAEPRSVRGRLRPRRARHRRRAVRRVPVELPGRRPRASIAGRAATGSSCRGSSAAPATHSAAAPDADARHRPLEDGRQPAPDAVRPARRRDARRRLDVAGGPGGRSGPAFVLATVDRPGRAARACRAPAATTGDLEAEPPSGASAPTSLLAATQVATRPHVPRPPGVADARRDRADAGPLYVTPPAACSNGRPPRRPRPAITRTSRGFYRPDGGRGRDRRRSRRSSSWSLNPDAAWIAAPFVVLWLLSPAGRRAGSACPAPRPRPAQLSAADARDAPPDGRRTWRFFETFVGPDDQRPAARQLPGRSAAGRRASHLADEHRDVPARDRDGAGLRLDRHARDGRAPRGDARDGRPPRAVPRPPLQLVRHARPAAARARVRVHGRQRQPRRPPARAVRTPAARWSSEPLPIGAGARAASATRIALTRRRPRRAPTDRRTQTLTRRHLDDALAALAAHARRRRRPDAWARAARRARGGRRDARGRRAGADGGARRRTRERARRAGRTRPRASRREPCPRPRAASAPAPAATATSHVAELADLRIAAMAPDADRRSGRSVATSLRRLRAIADARPSDCSARWTSRSSSTRRASSSRSATGSTDGTLDPSYYDLLASEARLTSFLAIAKGDVPPSTGSASAAR